MTDNNDDTVIGAANDETAVVARGTELAKALAWGDEAESTETAPHHFQDGDTDELDDDDDDLDDDDNSIPRIVWVFGAVIIVGVIYLAVMLGYALHRNPATPPAPTTSASAPTSTPVAAPPPSEASVPPPTATATVAPSTPRLEGVDAKFIADLRGSDPDSFFAKFSDADVISDARLVCSDMLHSTMTQNARDNLPGISSNDWVNFLDRATANYCPQLGGNV
jgi:hypothetical protein